MNGGVERAGRRGNNGPMMKYHQSRTWLLSCISHFADSSPADRERMRASIEEDYELSEDDESHHYDQDEPERQLAISTHHKAFDNIMGLLEYDTYEVTFPLVQMIRNALRDRRPAEPSQPSDDESMPAETYEEKVRRYTNCGMSEASDPDLLQEIHYRPRAETPPNTSGLMEF